MGEALNICKPGTYSLCSDPPNAWGLGTEEDFLLAFDGAPQCFSAQVVAKAVAVEAAEAEARRRVLARAARHHDEVGALEADRAPEG